MITFKKTLGKAGAYCIASYAATSATVLQRLSKHRDVRVRTAVADNENTSANTSMQLAHDNNADLRYAMAENHHIDKDTLDFLALDTNPFVADRARRTLLRLALSVPVHSVPAH